MSDTIGFWTDGSEMEDHQENKSWATTTFQEITQYGSSQG